MKINDLVRKLLRLLEKGNIRIAETDRRSDLEMHPDLDKAIDVLAALDEELKKE